MSSPNVESEGKTAWRQWNGVAWLVLLAAWWGVVWYHLSSEWRLNPRHQYGFVVPWLAAFLIWQRRSELRAAVFGGGKGGEWNEWWGVMIAWGLAVSGGLLKWVDPAWRLVSWMWMLSATGLTICWLWRAGGWLLVRRTAYPLFFLWLAAPWPALIEHPLNVGLMRGVAATVVHILNILGIAALQRGNVIELARIPVGVEDACSGLQSFQSGLMVALFLGGLRRLSWRRRAGLVLLTAPVALLGNLARTLWLALAAHARGAEGVSAQHDAAGYTVSALIFLSIAALAWSFPGEREIENGAESEQKNDRWVHLPGVDGFCWLGAWLLMPVMVWGWISFRGAMVSEQNEPLWQLRQAALPQGWSENKIKLDEKVLRELSCSDWDARQIQISGGWVKLFHFFWRPGIDVPSLAVGHTPDICLASVGWEQTSPVMPVIFKLEGRELRGVIFRFRQEQSEITVFHSTWHGGVEKLFTQLPNAVYGRWDRLTMLWEGRRNRGQEVLTVVMPSMGGGAKEERFFEEILKTVLVSGH
ncbi:MAG: exosortase/archaeosortase family protein [Verrucomicrobiae bacterium]|nr:exosortase/archaeosortase family protein [Verrucomicrobiae bacterium]